MDNCNGSDQLSSLIQEAAIQQNEKARAALYHRVYEDLHAAAHRLLGHRKRSEFQTTALVNEVIFRFERGGALASMDNRRVFFSVALRAMNQILIDHYRKRKKQIDCQDRSSEPLDAVVQQIEEKIGAGLDELQAELSRLANESPRQHAVIMHRFFGGLTIPQTAEILDVSEQTIQRDWRLARATLFRRLKDD